MLPGDRDGRRGSQSAPRDAVFPSGNRRTDTISLPHAACRRSLDNARHRAQSRPLALAPRHFSPQNNERCCLGIVGDGNFGAHGLLWIAKAHDETAPIGVGMVPTCAPGVVGTPVRNTVAPVPISPLVAPAAPVPTASTAIAHQLNERCRPKLYPRRVAPNRPACVGAAKARPTANARINVRIYISTKGTCAPLLANAG